jgi:homoserine kinase type II
MAVYTALDPQVLSAWLAQHDVGTLITCRGIASGIENSNFFVTTNDVGVEREFVVTLFERLSLAELPYYLSLMKHLAAHGSPCPEPMADHGGALCAMLADKPAAIVTRLPGRSIEHPGPAHCAAMGRQLARLHRRAPDFAMSQLNPRGFAWWIATAPRVRSYLDDDQGNLLDGEIAMLTTHWHAITRDLPRGAIHADVFRDNVLFVDDDRAPDIGGIIDFYFAGDDVFVLDLAICLNDWCIDLATGVFDEDRLQTFVAAYEEERVLSPDERAALPLMLRAGALRFWLSRLDDFHRPRPAQLLTPHDPRHFERILRRRRDEASCGARSTLFDREH